MCSNLSRDKLKHTRLDSLQVRVVAFIYNTFNAKFCFHINETFEALLSTAHILLVCTVKPKINSFLTEPLLLLKNSWSWLLVKLGTIHVLRNHKKGGEGQKTPNHDYVLNGWSLIHATKIWAASFLLEFRPWWLFQSYISKFVTVNLGGCRL